MLRGTLALRWRHNDHAGVSNHQPHGCLLNRVFRRKSKKTSKLRVTGLCTGNSPGTGEFPAQMASYAENVFIWWRHHEASEWSSAEINIPWSAVITQSNLSRYCIRQCVNINRTYFRLGSYNRHHIARPHGRAMGCLLWEIWKKTDGAIMPPHCI